MVEGLKPVDRAIVGNPPSEPIFDILNTVKPDIIALGYDQKHSRDSIKSGLDNNGWSQVEVIRVEGLADDLDGTRKIIARILSLWSGETGGPYEED
jgi:FAD synthetase